MVIESTINVTISVKTKGNQLFIEKQYNQALQTYMSGIRSTKSYLKTSLEPILKEKGTAANSSASLDFIHYVCDSLLLLVDNTSKQFSEKDQSIVNLVKSRIKFQETKLHILNDETSPLRLARYTVFLSYSVNFLKILRFSIHTYAANIFFVVEFCGQFITKLEEN